MQNRFSLSEKSSFSKKWAKVEFQFCSIKNDVLKSKFELCIFGLKIDICHSVLRNAGEPWRQRLKSGSAATMIYIWPIIWLHFFSQKFFTWICNFLFYFLSSSTRRKIKRVKKCTFFCSLKIPNLSQGQFFYIILRASGEVFCEKFKLQ